MKWRIRLLAALCFTPLPQLPNRFGYGLSQAGPRLRHLADSHQDEPTVPGCGRLAVKVTWSLTGLPGLFGFSEMYRFFFRSFGGSAGSGAFASHSSGTPFPFSSGLTSPSPSGSAGSTSQSSGMPFS